MHESHVKLGETHMKSGQHSTADLVIDFDAGMVTKRGKPLTLPDLTWRTLCCLLARPGAIISIDELIENVWGDVSVSNETVTQRIKLLRRALGDDGQNPRYVETIRGRGFRFIVEPENVKPKRRRPMLIGIAALTLAVIVGVLLVQERANQPYWGSDAERVIARANEYLSRVKLEDNQLAIELYEEALRRDPDNLDALVGLSFASSHNSSKFNMPLTWAKRAQGLAEKAISLGAGSQAHHALGFALDAQGQIDAALAQYEKAIELNPNNASTISSAAYLYQVRGELAKALAYGLRAHSINPYTTFSEVQIGATLYLLGRDAEGREWLDRGTMLKPDNVFIYTVRTYYQMSRGQFGTAKDTIDQALSRGIERPELYVHQGLIAAGNGQWEDARSSFTTATARDPSRRNGDAYNIWVRLMQGDTEARQSAEKWIAHKTVDSRFSWALLPGAGLNAAMGKPEDAIALLNQAVDHGFRDWQWLSNHVMFADIRETEDFTVIAERIQALVAKENAKVDSSR